MIPLKTDLTNCDREPIHIPGNIQHHGFFVGIDGSGTISFCSENIYTLANVEASTLLGQPISEFISAVSDPETISPIPSIISLFSAGHNIDEINPSPLKLSGKDYNLIISNSGKYILLEIEPAMPENQGFLQKMIGNSLSKMLIDKNLDHLIENTAQQVRSVIGFDRVMIYKFAPGGHGEVIAESRTEALSSWVGQHFPASDIPVQARELYKKNLVRLIANVDDSPSAILALEGLENLDLTFSQLRAVSPIHIQYLKNMGVVSSFSISLIYKTELWGLIACHNYSPKFIEFTARESAKLIGQILSSALEFREEELNHKTLENFNLQLDHIARQMTDDKNLIHSLTGHDSNLLSILDASGAVLFFENKLTVMGNVPKEVSLKKLMSWLSDHNTEQIFYTDHLESIFPEAALYSDLPSGVMLIVISKDLGEFILYFKPEQIDTVFWAGNPHLGKEKKIDGLVHISPRNSFELWAETVRAKSLPWSAEEIQSVTRLRQEIIYAVNLRAKTLRLLNERLRLAYDELDTFTYSVSHDLKNPISSIKLYAQLLLSDEKLSEKSKNIAQKIQSGADNMNIMIEEVLEYSRIERFEPNYSKVNVEKILAEICEEIKLLYHINCPQITFGRLHNIHADLAMVKRVFSNLIENATKYSQSRALPKIHIESVVDDKTVKYSITDNGIGINAIEMPRIFDLFSRMSNVGNIGGSGIGLAIVKRIIDRHKGQVWAESAIETGTVFYFAFNLPSLDS